MKKMLIILENNDTRYEFYMQGIRRSNIDDTIVRWELRYDVTKKLSLCSARSSNNKILGNTFENFVEKLLLNGFEEVCINQNNRPEAVIPREKEIKND